MLRSSLAATGLLCVLALPACNQRHDPSGAASVGVTHAAHIAPATCGDGKCDTDRKEDCAGCPADCGACTGCEVNLGAGCGKCKCEACVCAKRASCCKSGSHWTAECVKVCKEQCGGCGASNAAGKAASDG